MNSFFMMRCKQLERKGKPQEKPVWTRITMIHEQVQVDDQSIPPSSYYSFVVSGKYDEPDAPVKLTWNTKSEETLWNRAWLTHTHTIAHEFCLLHVLYRYQFWRNARIGVADSASLWEGFVPRRTRLISTRCLDGFSLLLAVHHFFQSLAT